MVYTVDSPQSGFPRIEQFLKVTGFCGDGRAVIQNVTPIANIGGPQSEGFGFGPLVNFRDFERSFAIPSALKDWR